LIKIAHIVNPVTKPKGTELQIAQPITFETMRRAKEESEGVELFSAQFKEDHKYIPSWLVKTPDLRLSTKMFTTPLFRRKLPLIREILDRLYQASNADYFIYTNVDIALQKNFYNRVREMIEHNLDAFIINRRTINTKYRHVTQLSQMYELKGQKHKGFDCFVFKREMYPKFYLANVAIGLRGIGAAMCRNLERFSLGYHVFRREFLTFHIGDRQQWRNNRVGNKYNMNEYHKVIKELKKVKYACIRDGDRSMWDRIPEELTEQPK